jgi:hypothetical protein
MKIDHEWPIHGDTRRGWNSVGPRQRQRKPWRCSGQSPKRGVCHRTSGSFLQANSTWASVQKTILASAWVLSSRANLSRSTIRTNEVAELPDSPVQFRVKTSLVSEAIQVQDRPHYKSRIRQAPESAAKEMHLSDTNHVILPWHGQYSTLGARANQQAQDPPEPCSPGPLETAQVQYL